MNRWIAAVYFGVGLYLGRVLELDCADAISLCQAAPAWCSLVGCLWIATRKDSYRFAALGLTGLFTDLTAPGRVGPSLCVGLLLGYALMRWFDSQRLRPHVGAVGIATTIAVEHFLRGIVHPLAFSVGGTWPDALTQSAATGLYTGLVAWLLLWCWRGSVRQRSFWHRPELA